MDTKLDAQPQSPKPKISLWLVARKFFVIGALSFGGSVIANIRDLVVNQQEWINDEEFMIVMSISQATPGLNAVNSTILIMDKVRGGWAAFIAVAALLAPGGLCVFLIGLFYGLNADHPFANHVLGGMIAASAAIMGFVSWKLSQKSLVNWKAILLTGVTFTLMAVVKIPLLYVLAISLSLGLWLFRPKKI